MTKDVGILVLGLIVAAMPFLGFPSQMEQIIFVISGLIIAILAFIIRGELGTKDEATESYSQNAGFGKSTSEMAVKGENMKHDKDGEQKK